MVDKNSMSDIKESLYKLGNGDQPPEKMIPLLKEELAEEMRRRFLTYKPYPPQLAFHNSNALERVMSGANQSGKSFAGAMEMAFHLTGIYPDWFKGRRLKPRLNEVTGRYELSFWVVGTDNKTVRDVLQKNIVGDMRDGFRGGVLHPDYVIQESMVRSRGVQDLIDTIKIRHVSGCDCRLQFRSYEQGRSNLQSATIDLVYCDEEPPEDIIGELRARLTATGGFMFMAFTPLSGMTALVQEFWNSEDQNEKFLVCMSIYESGHMSEEKLRAVESRYSGLSHAMRQARMYGIPTMGSGMVFEEEDFNIMQDPPNPIPYDWEYLGAMDFGRGEHPTVVLHGVRNPANGAVYIYAGFESKGKSIADIASRIKKMKGGDWIPMAYPHDLLKDSGIQGKNSKEGEGATYAAWYEEEGITMTSEHAKTELGSTRVEVGLIMMRKAMKDGLFFVSPSLMAWFAQKQIYRYGADLKPIKKKDDWIDASRYLFIMFRHAITNLENDLGDINNGVKDDTDIYS